MMRLASKSKWRKGEKIPLRNLLGHVVAAYWPSGTIVDPGGVLLCHDRELRGRRLLDCQIEGPPNQMAETRVENFPGLTRKSDTESRGHIPRDMRHPMNGNGFWPRSMQEVSA